LEDLRARDLLLLTRPLISLMLREEDKYLTRSSERLLMARSTPMYAMAERLRRKQLLISLRSSRFTTTLSITSQRTLMFQEMNSLSFTEPLTLHMMRILPLPLWLEVSGELKMKHQMLLLDHMLVVFQMPKTPEIDTSRPTQKHNHPSELVKMPTLLPGKLLLSLNTKDLLLDKSTRLLVHPLARNFSPNKLHQPKEVNTAEVQALSLLKDSEKEWPKEVQEVSGLKRCKRYHWFEESLQDHG
jgi:hypothetical protein